VSLPSLARDADDAPFWTGHPDAASFARIQEERIARARRHIERMLAARGPRTTENTLRPFDDAWVELDAAGSQASLIENAHPDAALRQAAEQATQRVAAYASELSLNREAYDALVAMDLAGADAVTRHYLERTLRDFRLAGVDRDAETRKQVLALREELVQIGQEFSRNIREDLRRITLDDASELEGLPADFVARHPPGPDGRITVTIDYPDAIPIMSYASRESVRQRLYMEFNNRGFPRNLEVLDRMIERRHRLAALLGFASWADYVTADKMVGSAGAASEFVERVAEATVARAAREHERLLACKRRSVPAAAVVNAWESQYWSEQVRRTEFDFDAQAVRPYFPYARVQQGVLDLAARLFGVEFRRTPEAPVWHSSVECWEMWQDGLLAGRLYLDMHPRPDKFNHAAEFDVRNGVAGRQLPEAALVCNLPGGESGDPGLLEHSDVVTLFHEFGHLMHCLFAGRLPWMGVAGIRTEHDFVEVPSELLEEWAWDPAVLAGFARHYQTDEPIPAEIVKRMKLARDYGKGLQIRRQMVLARLSLSYFDRDPSQVDTDALLKELTRRYQPYPFVEGTHMQCGFGHLDGYSAAYYTYMWSLVIAKDFFGQFDRADLLAAGAARRYRDVVLARGGAAPAAQLVTEFLGRPFRFDAWQQWVEEDR
jgi:thimet oligopeptidase